MNRIFLISVLILTLPIYGMHQQQKHPSKNVKNSELLEEGSIAQFEKGLQKAAYGGSLVDALILAEMYTSGSLTKPDAEKAQTFTAHAEWLKKQKKAFFIEKERGSYIWSSEQDALAGAERCFAKYMKDSTRIQKERNAQLYLEKNPWYKEVLRFLRRRPFEVHLAAKELAAEACNQERYERAVRAFEVLKDLLSRDKSAAVYQSVLDYLSSYNCDTYNHIYEDLLKIVYALAYDNEPLRRAVIQWTLESVKENPKRFLLFTKYGKAFHEEYQSQIGQALPLLSGYAEYDNIVKLLLKSSVPALREAAFTAILRFVGCYDESKADFFACELAHLALLDPQGNYYERFYEEAKNKKNDFAILLLFGQINHYREQNSALQKRILYDYLEILGEQASSDIKFETCTLPKDLSVKASALDITRISSIVEAGSKTHFEYVEPQFFARLKETLMAHEATPLARRAQLLNDCIKELTRNKSIECDEVKGLQHSISALPDSPFKQWAQIVFQARQIGLSCYETFMLRQELSELHKAHPDLPAFPEVLKRPYVREFNCFIPEPHADRPFEFISTALQSSFFGPGNLIYGYVKSNVGKGMHSVKEHVRLFACDKTSGLPVWVSSRQSAEPNMLGLYKGCLWELFKSKRKEENGQIAYNSTFILYNAATGDIKDEAVISEVTIHTKEKIVKVFFCEPFAVFLTEHGLYIMRDESQPLLVDLQNVSSRNAACIGKRIIFPHCGTTEAAEIAVYDLESGQWNRIPTGRPTDAQLRPEVFGNQQLLFIALPKQGKLPPALLCYNKEGCLWTFTLPYNLKKAILNSDGSLAYILTQYELMALETSGPKKRWARSCEHMWRSDYIDIQLSDDGAKLCALHLSAREECLSDAVHIIEAHSGRILQRWQAGVMGIFTFAGFYNNKPYGVQDYGHFPWNKSKKPE